jgi:hypothetical protein
MHSSNGKIFGMKLATLLAVSCLFSTSLFAAAKPSLISAYKGSYSGTGSLSGSGIVLPATTAFGTFQANKKKESGKLVVTAVFFSSGKSVVITHTFTFTKHGYTEFITGAGSVLASSGTARIAKKVISFNGAGSSMGMSYGETGTVRLTKNGLVVTDTLFIGPTVDTFSYTLKAKKKK